MTNPVGNEIIYAQGLDGAGRPAATTQPFTLQQVANLANTEDSSLSEVSITTVGNGTLTGAGLVAGQIARSGPTSNYTDTTDTAANIVAALPGFVAGASFLIRIKNATAFTQTLSAGTGVTLPATVIIPPFSFGWYFGTLGGTAASPTVTVVHMGTVPICDSISDTASSFTVLATNGAGTITAAGIAGGLTSRTTVAAAATDTTDTATAIVAAIGGLVNKVGTAFRYLYQNNSTAPITITGGTGVTVSGITIVPPGYTAEYLLTYTANTPTLTMVGVRLSNANNLGAVAAGASLTLTPANAGSTILLDTAAGSVVTLPAATGSGNVYKFAVKTTTTSGAHKILAASVSDFMNGIVTGENANTAKCFASAAATNHSLQMPFAGTQPSGGFIGDWFEITDIAPNLWTVKGMYQAGTTPTTPFSASTS